MSTADQLIFYARYIDKRSFTNYQLVGLLSLHCVNGTTQLVVCLGLVLQLPRIK